MIWLSSLQNFNPQYEFIYDQANFYTGFLSDRIVEAQTDPYLYSEKDFKTIDRMVKLKYEKFDQDPNLVENQINKYSFFAMILLNWF